MAGPLAAIERFFERLLERPAARLFQARLEPIHLQRHLERAMDAERRFGDRRTYVPSSYRIRLHPDDMAAFEPYRETLMADLAAAVHSHARSRGYTLTARPTVELEASADVHAGDVLVLARPVGDARIGRAGRSSEARAPGQPSTVERLQPTGGVPPERVPRPYQEPPPSTRQPRPAEAPEVVPDASLTRVPPGMPSRRSPPSLDLTPPARPETNERPVTASYAPPQAAVPKAVVAVRAPGQEVRRIPLAGGTVRVGRAVDNDIVVADERVSRHHGQFGVRLGTLIYTDLGSTNGSYLNGSSVTEIALGPGDVLQLGSSTLAIEQGD